MSNKNKLDQYYTAPHVASMCWFLIEQYLSRECIDVKSLEFVEPSAGSGAFLRGDLQIEAYDLEPKHNGIVEKDFLTVENLGGKVIVGNPPFGFASNLALKFINHCAKQKCEYVCFILPNTFRKKVFQDRVNEYLHLKLEYSLPKNSFILEGDRYDVPCVFQIWKLEDTPRGSLDVVEYLTLGCEEDYDFILRRVGGRAGKVISKEDYTKSSSLYVKGDVSLVHEFSDSILKEASMTAGVKSITLKEINYIITTNKSKETEIV